MLKVVDRWTVRDGRWEALGRPYDIDANHLRQYMGQPIPGKGAASHIFVKAKPNSAVRFFTQDATTPQSETRGTDAEGWVSFPMWKSAAYWPPNQGPWHVEVNGQRVTDQGIGLPEGLHVSTFLMVQDVSEPVLQPGPSVPGKDKIQVIVNGEIVWQN